MPDANLFFDKARAAGVLLFRYTPTRIRAVFHRGVNDEDARTAAAAVRETYLTVE